jgi:hypothetical protein
VRHVSRVDLRAASVVARLAPGGPPEAEPGAGAGPAAPRSGGAGGTLPSRDEELARTERWLAGLPGRISDPGNRRLMQSFATWQVMRRLRASAAANQRPRSTTAHARIQIKTAAGFLAWPGNRSQSLASCRHADADEWLATSPAAWQVHGFPGWAAGRGHCHAFTISGPGRTPGTATSPDQRWALAARLLSDHNLDATDRVAGCLLLPLRPAPIPHRRPYHRAGHPAR